MEESIFQPYLSTRTIFKMDREILRPSYLPDRLPHRESHIGQLAQILVTVALDEIDKLVQKNGDDILYQLLKINDDLSKARVSLIGISNELTFTEYLDPRVRSRLADEKMVFPPYNADELYDILAERSRLAFENGTATDGVTPLTQRRVTDLISELDMLGLVHARVRSFGRGGRTKEIQASVPLLEVKKVLEKDEILAEARGYRLKVQTTLL